VSQWLVSFAKPATISFLATRHPHPTCSLTLTSTQRRHKESSTPNSLLAQMLSTELINYRGPSSASSNFANIFVTQDGVSQRLFNHLAAHSKSLTLPSSYEHHIQASGPHHICSQGDGDAQSATRIKSPSPGHLLGVN
jgi:hypothetical protein